jgi:hypothetical protein
MCREHAPEAVATLVAALKDPRHKVAAAQALLDRGFGRAPLTIADDSASPIAMHLLAAQLISAQILEMQVEPQPQMQQEQPQPQRLLDAPPLE